MEALSLHAQTGTWDIPTGLCSICGCARRASSCGVWHDNAPSLAVSKSLGYRANGDEIKARVDKPARMINLKLPQATWQKARRDDITIEGLEACLDLFGLAGDPAAA
jgi:hypothetical protein